jgi:nicotinamidase-related amidase
VKLNSFRSLIIKIAVVALYTEICLAMPAIQALGEGYEVFIVTDASGGVTAEAHDIAVRRMVQAGAIPINWRDKFDVGRIFNHWHR